MTSIQVDINKVKAELCKRDLAFFVREFWDYINNQPLQWNWHLDVICEELMYISRRVYDKLPKDGDCIINVPPGTSKTKIASVLATCWDFANKPDIREFVGSYSDSASLSIAYDIRNVMRSDKYRLYFPEVQVSKDFDTKHEFRTTKGGHFFAFTIGGTLTSKHADILKVDDPLNPNEVSSQAAILTTNRFFDFTLPTRKTNKDVTPTILIMQRLDENDPSGHLLRKPGKHIRHLCLPGEVSDKVKPAHLKEKYIDGLLDPIRLKRSTLADSKIDMGSAGYSAQIMQDPIPDGGAIWQKWFIEVDDRLWPLRKQFTMYGTDWDTAYTEKEDNAASAYMTGGKIGNDIYIDDFGFDWLEFPQLVKWIQSKEGPHHVEDKASGKSLQQVLRRWGINVILVGVQGGDKVARAKMATVPAEAGRVFIRKSLADRLYNDDKQGILKFPKGKFKDVADVLAQFIQRLDKRGGIISYDPEVEVIEKNPTTSMRDLFEHI